jgi:cysteine desulfurase family protein (TIGR01976 family)
MVDYLIQANANRGGSFQTSHDSDVLLEKTRTSLANFLNASRPEEIVFGLNMTSLTYTLSRSIGRNWGSGDEIIVTHLDHDANITPWVQVAEDRGCTLRWVDFDVEDCTLNLTQFQKLLSPRTKMVAVGYASNAVGTINPLPQIIQQAHQAGALCYIDAVHYAPHGPIDVQALDCDFLVLSAYKFFGPHIGALYGKYDLLDELNAYKVRPAPKHPPGKFETGTQNHEGIAGVLGVLEYLRDLGDRYGDEFMERYANRFAGQTLNLKIAMAAIRAYEMELSRALLSTLQEIPGLRLYGIQDPDDLDQRAPTFSFTLEGIPPRQVAEKLAANDIFVWDGNYYALAVTERLEIEEDGGMVRVGPVHYNTLEEIERLGEALLRIVEDR